METSYSYESYWICQKCGAMIPWGQQHVCSNPTYIFTPVNNNEASIQRLDRIIELLESILRRI